MKKSLTKKERIGKKDISRVFEVSESIKRSGVRFLYCRNGKTWNRIAVVLGKKYGNSVERNRTKRIIKEVYRNLKNDLQDVGFDFIFYIVGKVKNYEVANSIVFSLLKKAGFKFDK